MFSQALQILKQARGGRLVFRTCYEKLCQSREVKPNKHRRSRAFYAPIFFNYFKSFSINLNAFEPISDPFINLNRFSFFYILINKSYSLTLFQKINTNGAW